MRTFKMTNTTDTTAEHRRTWDAIPWVVNGSATEDQRRVVEAHVPDCADCRDELARQRELQAAMTSEQATTLTNADAGLKRLFQRIDDAEADAAVASASAPTPRQERRGSARWLVYGLTMAVVVEAIGISVLGMGLLYRASDYQTLSMPAVAAGAQATIRIVPTPGLRADELQRLLQGLNLQVVSGPNAVGAYGLASLAPAAQLDKQIDALRSAPGLQLVEPIVQPDARP
jgi:anti-sigma factor RsiW